MAESEHPDASPGAPTLMDVARAAGVSRQTVSNVLHAPEKVRPATREKVERYVRLLSYEPNRQAQSLARSASRMIGYRIQPLAAGALASIHDRFLHALAEAGQAADHHLVLFPATDPEAEIAGMTRLHRGGTADTFVLYDVTADDPRPAALLALGVPFVAFGRTRTGTDAYTWIDVDGATGIGDAVVHLAHRGHRRIAYLGWAEGSTIGDRRATGWAEALDREGLSAGRDELQVQSPDSVPEAIQATFRLLDRPDPPTAILTGSDTLAVGALQAAQHWGLTVGRDLAVIGFDDTPTAAALNLSSIRQPIEQVGRRVAAALLRPSSAAPTGELLHTQLIIRSSSAGPAPGRG